MGYMAIPIALLFFLLRRRDVPLRAIFWLFAAFILSCGITHLLDATMFYRPMYRLLGLAKLVTAVVSATTVVALIRVLPSALRLPSILQAQETEIAARKAVEAEVRELSLKLQDRNSHLTVQTRRMESAMDAARVGVLSWRAKTGSIEWEVGVRNALRHDNDPLPVFERWADVLDIADLTKLLVSSMKSVQSGSPMALEMPLRADRGPRRIVRVSGTAQRGITGDNATIIGFARVVEAEPETH